MVTDKQHRLKPHPHSVQKLPDISSWSVQHSLESVNRRTNSNPLLTHSISPGFVMLLIGSFKIGKKWHDLMHHGLVDSN